MRNQVEYLSELLHSLRIRQQPHHVADDSLDASQVHERILYTPLKVVQLLLEALKQVKVAVDES